MEDVKQKGYLITQAIREEIKGSDDESLDEITLIGFEINYTIINVCNTILRESNIEETSLAREYNVFNKELEHKEVSQYHAGVSPAPAHWTVTRKK